MNGNGQRPPSVGIEMRDVIEEMGRRVGLYETERSFLIVENQALHKRIEELETALEKERRNAAGEIVGS